MILPTGIADSLIVGFLSMLALGLLWLEHNKKSDPLPELLARVKELEGATSSIKLIDAKFDDKFGKLEAKVNHYAISKSNNLGEGKLPKFQF